MKDTLILDANDIKAIIAKHFNVPESNVIKAQYSYIVTEGGDADVHKQKSSNSE